VIGASIAGASGEAGEKCLMLLVRLSRRCKSYENPVPFLAADGRLWLFHASQSTGEGQADAQVLSSRLGDNRIRSSNPSCFLQNLAPSGAVHRHH
jgi:hypothetical protein